MTTRRVLPPGAVPIASNLASSQLADGDGGAHAVIEHYRRILNNAVDTAIVTFDASGVVTGWSEGAQRMLGWTEEEMLGRSLACIFPADVGGHLVLQREVEEAVRQGTGRSEGWRVRKNGDRFWAIGEVRALWNGQPQAGFVKVLRDRTQVRETEMALRERTRALETLNRAGTALGQENELGKVVQIVTDAGVELTGAEVGAFFYNVENADGESNMLFTISGVPRDAFSRFPMPRNTAVFEATFSGSGIVRSDDITCDHRYGHNAPYAGMPAGHLPVRSYLAVPVVSRSGKVLGGLFFGHSQPAMFREDSERNLTGLAGEAAVAIDNVRLFEATQVEIEERRRAEAALQELNCRLEEQVRVRSEELVRNAEALRQAQKMEALGQLTGGIAHDFNNLLQVIVTNLEILSRGLPDGRLRRAVDYAMSGARRAGSLTQRLLAFARRQPLDPKPLDLALVVREASDLLRRVLGETVTLETRVSPDVWTIEADPNELENALLNLAVNARDAMPTGGVLKIETFNCNVDVLSGSPKHPGLRPGQYVVICVIDNGVGMDQRTVGRAVEPFFTTKPAGKGTGLGLSQVYGFVKQSHGYLKLESALGKGTTVFMYLPRYEAGTQPVDDGAIEELPWGRGETILVVEDDGEVRASVIAALHDVGYRLLEASNGEAAISILERESVDLVMADMILPGGITGREVIEAGCDIQARVKGILITGYAVPSMPPAGLRETVTVVVKPFTLLDLTTAVRSTLDGRQKSGDGDEGNAGA
ncbi:Histidine kinase [Paraburkholderia tropica]|uniref:ATP-binding protein n=1 Tax=Paraburkholderia tropica TaxID=92647 RepID=UPI001CABA13B|nr:ATP-binding protein [Paraburkholderia tropica]CAG9208619.1 Histidine kinase [Paraburkholderia tropica]